MTVNTGVPKRFVFRCIDGPATNFVIEPGQVLTVGRECADCAADVIIPHPAVSRQHFRVKSDGAVCYIQDLGTRCGVPILRAVDLKKLTPEQRAQTVRGFHEWPWQKLPKEQWQALEEGDLVALPDIHFEVVSEAATPIEGSPTIPPGSDSIPSNGPETTVDEAERLGWLDGAEGGMDDLIPRP